MRWGVSQRVAGHVGIVLTGRRADDLTCGRSGGRPTPLLLVPSARA